MAVWWWGGGCPASDGVVGSARVFSSESVALNISIASARARQVATAELIVPTLSRGGDNGPTEKPGTILTRVRVPGAVRDFSPGVNFHWRCFYGVRIAPPPSPPTKPPLPAAPRPPNHPPSSRCAFACIKTLSLPDAGSHTIVWTHKKCCTH